MSSSIKRKSLSGSVWSLVDNLCCQGFAFFIGIILARLLSPDDYGTIGVVAIFMAIANVFVDCGFGNALIRKKNRTQNDLSTAFYFNIAVGLAVYLVLFAISPLVAMFFKMSILVPLLRVLGLCVIFNALSIVQISVLTADLNIRSIAISNLLTQIPMGCLGVYFAYKGLGVWTLVVQQVGCALLRSIWLWVISKWRPSFIFSKVSFSYLFNFGWKLLCANLLGSFFNEIYSFVIGRHLGASDLGFYTKAKQLAEYPRTIINNVVTRVVLPIMVETQGDLNQVRNIYRRLIRLLGLIIFPVFGLLILIANPMIMILWTDKWNNSILLFQLFCVGLAFGPISTLNFCLLQLLNRTDLTLKLEFVKKPVCFAMLVISLFWGLKGIVFFASLYNIVGTLINMYPTISLLNYNLKNQIKDLSIGFFITFFTIGVLYYPLTNVSSQWFRIILSLITFTPLYCAVSYFSCRDTVKDMLNLIKK